MILKVRSPFVKTLLLVNVVFLSALLVPMYWPLPSFEIRDVEDGEGDLSALMGSTVETVIDEAKERPLFHANRRPEIAVKAEEKPVIRQAEVSLNLTLMGVLKAADGEQVAYLQNKGTGATVSARVSDTVDNWVVEEIGPSKVVLTSGTVRRTLDLNSGG